MSLGRRRGPPLSSRLRPATIPRCSLISQRFWNHRLATIAGMPRPMHSAVIAASLLVFAGCAHQWSPGPGHSMADLGVAEANCRLTVGDELGFSSYGPVAAIAVGGVLYAAVEGIREGNQFDDCMRSNGFVVGGEAASPNQQVVAGPLPPPDVASSHVRQTAGWAAVQRTLARDNESGAAIAVYRSLCKAGDASACAMAKALDPHAKLTASR